MYVSYTIRKRKDTGNYQAIIRQKQGRKWKQVESKSFKGKPQANQWAIDRSSYWQSKTTTTYEKMTINQLLDIYLQYIKDTKKHSTYILAKNNLKKIRAYGDQKPTDILPHEYHQISKNMGNAGYRLRAFYNFMINELGMDIKNHIKPKQLKRGQAIILVKSDFEQIIKQVKQPEKKLAMKIGYYQGLRISEISGLTWDSITPTILKVNKQRSILEQKFVTPKSKNSYREIPIKKELYVELMRYKSNLKTIDISNRVFSEKYLGITINNELKRILKDTKYEGLTTHDFRHSFITNLVQNNVDVKTVAYIAGDKVETILKNYVHTNKNTLEIASKAINSL